jgi:glyoxylase-like metal-dependent hydrolase (beta-lactamase superfamily II)
MASPYETSAFFDPVTSTVTYVVSDARSGDAIVIDPVLDYEPQGSFTSTKSIEPVLRLLEERKLRLRATLETHAHADHLSASQLLKKKLGATVAIGKDIVLVQDTFKKIFNLGDEARTDGSQFDLLLDDNRRYEFGSIVVQPIPTPGHTPACQSFLIGDAIFTGDTLFLEDYGTGRTDFPAGSASSLYKSITQKLFSLPPDTRVFVGHDYLPLGREFRCESTIAKQRDENVQLSSKTSEEEFVQFRKDRDRGLPAPRLLFQSVLVNVFGGTLPEQESNGVRYLKIPINLRRGVDEVGLPVEAEKES